MLYPVGIFRAPTALPTGMVDALIYARLSASSSLSALVGANVYPTTPTTDTALPFVVYTIDGQEPQTHLRGAAALTRYDVTVDVYGTTYGQVGAILSYVRDALHCWSSVEVRGCFLSGGSSQQEEYGYHGQHIYSLWSAG